MTSNLRPPCLFRWKEIVELQFCEIWRPLDLDVSRISEANFTKIGRKGELHQALQLPDTPNQGVEVYTRERVKLCEAQIQSPQPPTFTKGSQTARPATDYQILSDRILQFGIHLREGRGGCNEDLQSWAYPPQQPGCLTISALICYATHVQLLDIVL